MECTNLYLTGYIQLNDQIYEQIKGTTIASPISRLIAEVVVQRLQNIVLSMINLKIWIRYADNTFVITKRNDFDKTYNLINNVSGDIEFTGEDQSENKTSVLDVLVKRTTTGKLYRN